MKKVNEQKRENKSLKALRVALSFLMLSGNGWFVPSVLRYGVTAFAAAFLLPLKAMASSSGPRQRSFQPEYKVTDQRDLRLSDDPSDFDLAQVSQLGGPFYPGSAPMVEGENAALAKAIKVDLAARDGDLSSLSGFAATYPHSRWVLAAELNRGLALYKRGYFSKAVEAYQAAWDAGQDENGSTNPKAKGLADRALAELIRMNSRVGRKDEVKRLLGLMNGRKPVGTAGRWYEDAKSALWVMENRPEKAFFCGPYGLQQILAFQRSPKAKDPLFRETKSPDTGFSLEEVWELSNRLGMRMRPAKRTPGAKVLLPALANWKLGHYAALVEEKNGYVHSVDPTFGNETWLSGKALDEESSGYFLVPDGSLPSGWQWVGAEEADKVFGKGYIRGIEPQLPPCSEVLARPCEDCGYAALGGDGVGRFYNDSANVNDGGFGGAIAFTTQDEGGVGNYLLPSVNIDQAQVALVLTYKPLGYHPPVGPAMDMTLTYHQKSALAQTNVVSPFGTNWNFSWFGFVQYDLGGSGPSDYGLFARGGGAELFSPDGFTPYTHSQMVVTQSDSDQNPTGFKRLLPNGWTEYYTNAVLQTNVAQVFLTGVVDAKGNAVSIHYNADNQPDLITDALGQQTTLTYTDGMVTQITDPFNRTASFQYGGGLLTSSNNVLGMESDFAYGGNSALSGDWISTLTTPYGMTNMDFTGSDNNSDNEIDITDPQQLREHARFAQPQSPTDGGDLSDPNGDFPDDAFMNERNTFYWDKDTMASAPLAASSATVYHWLHTPQSHLANVLECYKKPLESRVWYNYPGQIAVMHEDGITQFLPVNFAREFGGEVQMSTAAYNSFGKMTSSTDPAERKVVYSYANNGIDLQGVSDGNGDVLASYNYNSQHEPSRYVDAAGQPWNYVYNGAGEVTSEQTPAGELTTYSYDNKGYLLTVTPPQLGAAVTFTYYNSGYNTGCVQTSTDAVRGLLTYSYDNADRLTEVDYPDGTSTVYNYTNLNLASVKDRESRTTNYAYDLDGRMTDVTDPKGQLTHYQWSGDEIQSVKDPGGNEMDYTRDIQGRVARKSYTGGASYGYAYGDTGDLGQVTDGNGQVKGMSYNEDDTVASIQYANAAVTTAQVNFLYDLIVPRVTSMSDGTGTTSYTYGRFGQTGGGQVQSVSSPVGAGLVNIGYSYDADGRVAQRIIGSVGVTFGYNNAQLVSVGNPLGSFTYGYDPNSARLINVTYPNGQAVSMDYFGSSDVNGASGSLKDLVNMGASAVTLSKFCYKYKAEGEINQWTKQLGLNAPVTVSPNYDQVSQLRNAESDGALGSESSQGYSYSADGSVTQMTSNDTAGNSSSQTLVTDDHDQVTQVQANPLPVQGATDDPAQIYVDGQPVAENGQDDFNASVAPQEGVSQTAVTVVAWDPSNGTVDSEVENLPNSAAVSYDGNGNLLQDDQRTYQWDAENRLVSMVYLNPLPNNPATIQMGYDGLGRRVSISQYDSDGTLLKANSYVWCGNTLCQERDTTGATVTKQFFAQGEVINNTSYFYTKDHLGSVREMTDNSGNLKVQYDYDAYGNQKQMVGLVGPGQLASDFGFTGFYQQAGTNLSLTLYRAYDPMKGSWLSRDPLGKGASLYAYAGGNPLGMVDPLGLDATPNNGGGTENGGIAGYGVPSYWESIHIYADTVFGPGNLGMGAVNAARAIAADAQMAEKGVALFGAGTGKVLEQAGRLAAEYGGEAKDWVKMRSVGSYYEKGKALFQSRWYENVATGARVEYKVVIDKLERLYR